MKYRRGWAALTGLLLVTLACSQLPTGASPTPTQTAVVSATLPSLPPTASPTTVVEGPPEAIAILAPANGSRLVSPLTVEGVADPTFENHLGLRLLTMDGTTLAAGAAIIEAPIGERGTFQGELAFSVSAEQPATLQVFASSARDGGLTHLASVVVTLAPGGAQAVVMQPEAAERIQIDQPVNGAVFEGGTVTVSGFGWASFENTLVAEAYDADGTLIGQAAITINSTEMGQPGDFNVELSYSLSQAGPGRIVVLDPSPAFGGPVHLASVEVELRP
jgi:hypothetical protein